MRTLIVLMMFSFISPSFADGNKHARACDDGTRKIRYQGTVFCVGLRTGDSVTVDSVTLTHRGDYIYLVTTDKDHAGTLFRAVKHRRFGAPLSLLRLPDHDQVE